VNGKVVRPFHKLAEPIRDPCLEGLDKDNLHFFYHHLGDSPLFSYADPKANFPGFRINRDMLLTYEQNIVRHTQTINEKRHRPIVWKYYQWLTLLFVEIYLDRFFSNREGMLADLNAFVDRDGCLFTVTVHRKPVGEMELVGVTPKRSGKIVEFMRENALITIPELAEKIGVTERSVEQNIQKLQDRGIVRRIGPAKGGHWEVLFRL